MREELRIAAGFGAHTAVLMLVSGIAVILSGSPFLFPSLGPSAYVLAVMPHSPASNPQRVIGGHAIGIIAGLIAYAIFGHGLIATTPPTPFSTDGIRLTMSAALSVGLTTGGMRATRFQHPPACATTLIVSLGLLSTLRAAVIILLSVCLLVLADKLYLALTDDAADDADEADETGDADEADDADDVNETAVTTRAE
ncbi:HPP family protein [Haloferacaceae archaeon DSL9]